MRRVPCSMQKKGTDGKSLCLVCNKSLTGRQTSYCSKECWIRNTPSLIRKLVWKRDLGICAICKIQCDTLKSQVARLILIKQTIADRKLAALFSGAIKNIKRIRLQYNTGLRWQADHIVPVIEGGGLCGLDGYRTLCTTCHKQVSANLAGRLASARRNEKDKSHESL